MEPTVLPEPTTAPAPSGAATDAAELVRRETPLVPEDPTDPKEDGGEAGVRMEEAESDRGESRRKRSRSRDSGSHSHSRERRRRRSKLDKEEGQRGGSRFRARARSRSRSPSSGSSLASEEEALPVLAYKDELMQAVRENRVVICKGETGSGKTTQFPQYLLDGEVTADSLQSLPVPELTRDSSPYEMLVFDPPGLVGVTQPRRVAAVSVATRVAQERGCRLGEEVGYQIRFEDRTTRRTRIKFMTDGCLVRECLADPTLSKYSFVMLDEAHERSVNTDVLFGLAKRAIGLRPDLKVIVTSATLDVQKFSEYFNKCPIKEIPVRTHPVTLYHSKTKFVMTPTGPANQTYIQSLVDIALKIHRTQDEGHILAFLTGQDEIEKACGMLNKALQDDANRPKPHDDDGHVYPTKMLVSPLYGNLTSEQQIKVFQPVSHHVRKCIIATNIAETSVTVPGVRFVIDPGFVKQKTYNPERRMESLVVVPISRVAAEQRAGRAGRTGPGQCYRLYSKDCLDEMMMAETVPEIRRCNLANVILFLKVLGIEDVVGFDYFEPPSVEQLHEGLLLLHALGALDDDGHVSDLGRCMSKFPLDPCLSRALIQAKDEHCLKEVITISAMLSVETIWYNRRREKGERDEEAERAHTVFRHPHGDHITYLMVYAAYEDRKYSDDWCREAFLSVRALRNARNIRLQLEGEVRKALGGQVKITSAKDIHSVSKAISAGFFMNAGSRCGNDRVYKHMPSLMPLEEMKLVYLHPTSVFASTCAPPQYAVYHEVVVTARPMMRHVLAVERSWLQQFRQRMGTVGISRLSDGQIGKQPVEEKGAGEENGKQGGKREEKRDTKTSADAVAAARARFLERKKTKS